MTRLHFYGLTSIFLLLACSAGPTEPEISQVSSSLKVAEQGRVTICHAPDDGSAPNTIVVAAPALPAHLRHSDTIGECASGCSATTCDDGDACTSDTCQADGECAHAAVECDDGNPCSTEICEKVQGCTTGAAPENTACDDGNACTDSDRCVGVVCQGGAVPGCCQTAMDCDDQDACTNNTCESQRCVVTNVNCAVPDACIAGFCDPTTGSCDAVPITCDDGDPCTDDDCDSSVGCTHQHVRGCGETCCENRGTCLPRSELDLNQDVLRSCVFEGLACVPNDDLLNPIPCTVIYLQVVQYSGFCVSTCLDLGQVALVLSQGSCPENYECLPY